MNKKQDNLDYIKGYGKNYANLRKKEYNHTKDYTVRELSKELLIASSTISKIENESVPPTVEQVKAYKKFFHVSLDYLTGETKVMRSDIQMICEYTGLSEDAAEKLHELSTAEFVHNRVDRPSKGCEIVKEVSLSDVNDYLKDFINSVITDDNFTTILTRAYKLKKDIADMREPFLDNDKETETIMMLSEDKIKDMHKLRRFVVTDDGHIEHTLDRMKEDFKKILENIFDDEEILDEKIEKTERKLNELMKLKRKKQKT